MVEILIMSAKMATPGYLKVKLFWNNSYDVIIIVHAVFNKTLSGDANYIVDMIMWPKLSNSSGSIRELIITSAL